jgi:(1->4)-alpha-D-glucan 1-alpha-D-glucosylmutase
VVAWSLKAVPEAKVRSSWVNPDPDYEEAASAFVRALVSGPVDNGFLREFLPLARRLARIGVWNGLSQLVLKLASPGVPDVYQGNEIWELALVDPDNRRPVDFPRRARMLDDLERRMADGGDSHARLVGELLSAPEDGRIKLWVTWRGLTLRRELEPVFRHGSYEPLRCLGARADHLCAFARSGLGSTVVVVVARSFAALAAPEGSFPVGPDVWADTRIELPRDVRSPLVDHLTGEHVEPSADGTLAAGAALAGLPAALLVSRG